MVGLVAAAARDATAARVGPRDAVPSGASSLPGQKSVCSSPFVLMTGHLQKCGSFAAGALKRLQSSVLSDMSHSFAHRKLLQPRSLQLTASP